ncbi:M1 aminopeptidase family protein [Aurantiacibacter sediminis]|uniref:Peptidase M1 membrane alanine aminopeptidase domain-containing protein n=1 Tax=Aurantiacibacter sediminis TaxID=2793064 RepID=A0ABS0N2I7_9SPHN|nr:hypothetical protein [Aurantiacibacter sediminis]MBH5322178.1 hypothetical protein [Aurantiacibacter sediminis]
MANLYDLEVDVTPVSKHLAVRGTIEIVADGPTTEAAFMLNNGLEIERFEPSVPATMSREGAIVLGTYEMPNTQRVTLRFAQPLQAGQRVTIDLAYAGFIRDDSIEWGRGLISEDWTELSLGTLWYPYWRDENRLRSRISVQVPDGYRVIGPGEIERDANGRWIVDPGKPILGRITFAASPRYTITARQLAPGLEARLHTLGSEPRADEMLARARDAYAYYTNLIGPPRGARDEVKIIYANPDIGVTRSRMAYATGGDYFFIGVAPPQEQDFTIAHELAHFWWISGAAGTPDEFMTESLAEYVAQRYAQTVWGDEWLGEKFEQMQRVSGSIEGSMRDEGEFDGRETLLYFRGPLILWDLHRRIGTEAMDALLVRSHAEDISELQGFIDLIEDREGAEVARWFEQRL